MCFFLCVAVVVMCTDSLVSRVRTYMSFRNSSLWNYRVYNRSTLDTGTVFITNNGVICLVRYCDEYSTIVQIYNAQRPIARVFHVHLRHYPCAYVTNVFVSHSAPLYQTAKVPKPWHRIVWKKIRKWRKTKKKKKMFFISSIWSDNNIIEIIFNRLTESADIRMRLLRE